MADDEDIRIIGELATLHLEPGDVVVFMCPGTLSVQAEMHLRGALEGVFPDHKCVVLEEGAKLAAVRPESLDSLTPG